MARSLSGFVKRSNWPTRVSARPHSLRSPKRKHLGRESGDGTRESGGAVRMRLSYSPAFRIRVAGPGSRSAHTILPSQSSGSGGRAEKWGTNPESCRAHVSLLPSPSSGSGRRGGRVGAGPECLRAHALPSGSGQLPKEVPARQEILGSPRRLSSFRNHSLLWLKKLHLPAGRRKGRGTSKYRGLARRGRPDLGRAERGPSAGPCEGDFQPAVRAAVFLPSPWPSLSGTSRRRHPRW